MSNIFRIPNMKWPLCRTWLLLACVMLIGAPRAGWAQRADVVAEPITTPELMRYADMLGLSDQQKLGLFAPHDAYKKRFQEFLDRDVRKFLDEVLNIALPLTRFEGGRFSIPERKELEAVLEKYKRLIATAHAIDRSLFNEIQIGLTEEQLQKLPRASGARELMVYREFLREFVGEANRGAGINLTEFIRRLDLTPTESEQSEPILTEYENALLGKARDVYAILLKAANVVLDTLDELGLRAMTVEKMLAIMAEERTVDRLRAKFDEASKPFQAAAFDISQLNLRTLKRLCGVLKPDNAAELRTMYFQRAYSRYFTADNWRERYRRAVELETISPSQKEAISAQGDDFVRQDDALADSLAAAVEAAREYRTSRQFENEEGDAAMQKPRDLKDRRERLAKGANAALDNLLGADLIAELDKMVKEKSQRNRRDQPRRIDDDDGGEDVASATGGSTAPAAAGERQNNANPLPDDPLLPQPITVAEFQSISKRIGWSEADRATISSMYDDYRAEYDRLRAAPLNPSSSTETEIQSQSDAKSDAQSSAKPADENKIRKQRFEELGLLDDSFFDNISLVAESEAQQQGLRRLRALRQRETANQVARRAVTFFRAGEGALDIVGVVHACDLNTGTLQSINDILTQYEGTVAPLVQKRLAAAEELHRRSNWQRGAQGRQGNQQASQFVQTKWREAFQDLRETTTQIASLNRQTLDQVLALVPAEVGWAVKLNYNQAAYPDLYQDSVRSEKILNALLSMPDLPGAQRDQVHEIANEFRSDYYMLCESLVDLRRQRDSDQREFRRGGMPDRAFIQREIRSQQLMFDREEAAARARARLRLALSPDIVRRVPDLRR